MTVKSEPKKRGRKAKKTTDNTTPSVPKKRGRKPKGGKIIENTKITVTEPPQKPNVILHLKCNSKDINVSLDHEFIQNNNNNNFLSFEILEIIQAIEKKAISIPNIQKYIQFNKDINHCTSEIIELISKSKIFVHHFHIPLQSGSNKILNGMSRRYTSELYEDRVKYIKYLMPNACIGGDVIVGFPGEDNSEFDKTLKFIKDLDISYLHVFPYSERENTRALSLNESVPIEIRNKRSKVLRLLSDKKKRYFYESNIKNVRNVLFENKVKGDFIYGFTDNYVKTKIKFNRNLVGKQCNVLLKKVDNDLSVIGEII